jgi:hypothetical protein
MKRLSLRNNQLKFKTAGKSPTILEEFIGMYRNTIAGSPLGERIFFF